MRWLWAALGLAACGPPTTHSLTVASEHTGETYRLEVLSPGSHRDDEALPLVVVLDGHYHFDALARHVDRAWRRDRLAPFRLAGVSYAGLDPHRVADLVTIAEKRTDDLSFPASDHSGQPEGGGGDRFHAALTTELLPAVEADFATRPGDRTLMGHSLGGHFALLDALHFAPHDSAFSQIVAASPSIWWAEGSLLEDEAALADDPDGLPFHLIVGVGTLEGTAMLGPKAALVDRLRARDHAGLRVEELDVVAGHMEAAAGIFEGALAKLHP